MEQIRIDKKGHVYTEAVNIDIQVERESKNRLIKQFLPNEIFESYKDFEDLFLINADHLVANYELTRDIKEILINVYNQITGNIFLKIDPVTGKYIEASEADRQKGLYIAGPTGTGKTTFCKILFATLSNCVLKFMYSDKIYHFNTICTTELQLNKEYMRTGDFYYINRSSLFIDDIGQSKEVSYMGNKLDPIKEVITERYDNLKYTFTSFTSNYPINHKSLIDQYGERVADRIQAMCNYYIINAKNFRK